MRRLGWLGVVGLMGGLGWAQTATTLVEPETPLLPQSFGSWQQQAVSDVPQQSFSLVNVNKDALEECSPNRSKTADYVSKEKGRLRNLHVEAVEFADATGAYSAFTLSLRQGLKVGKEIGVVTAVGDGGVLFESGSSLVLAYPATAADIPELKKLDLALPKVGGTKALAPLLPTFFPAKGLEQGSLRYALGRATYAAVGGTLPAAQLGWEKNAEAALAQYGDKRGRETLTILLYPTPQIAGEHTRSLEAATQGSAAKVRREGELVMVAQGSFSADAAQNMIENIHLRSEVSFDKALPPSFPTEIRKTYSLLTSIAILAGVGALAAVLLGLFLGGGRAMLRVLRGKDAATEAEFLSLHLDPQNEPAKFNAPKP